MKIIINNIQFLRVGIEPTTVAIYASARHVTDSIKNVYIFSKKKYFSLLSVVLHTLKNDIIMRTSILQCL